MSKPRVDGAPCAPRRRVVIVEDDAVFQEHLRAVIGMRGDLVLDGVFATRAAGLRALERRPDLLLVDVGLPDGSGLDVMVAARRQLGLDCRIVVVSVFGDAATVVKAIEAGADGYLLKGADGPTSLEAIDVVLRGGSPISPAVAGHILARVRQSSATPPEPRGGSPTTGASLTPREIQLLSDLSKGFSYKEIANLHRISYHTVADHVKSIYRKMAVSSRGEAVYEAMQTGLLPTRA